MQAACFMLQFAADNLLLPGKVENWMCISDLGYRGLSDLPLNTLRKITKVLQDIFKCRLAFSAMINCPKSVYFIYSCLKPFLDPVTIDKIAVAKTNVAHEVISYFNPYQVEERYGGKAPNLTVFWPPVFPKIPVDLDYVHAEVIEEEEEESQRGYEEPAADSAELEMERQKELELEMEMERDKERVREREYEESIREAKERRREKRRERRERRERKINTARAEEKEVKRKSKNKRTRESVKSDRADVMDIESYDEIQNGEVAPNNNTQEVEPDPDPQDIDTTSIVYLNQEPSPLLMENSNKITLCNLELGSPCNLL